MNKWRYCRTGFLLSCCLSAGVSWGQEKAKNPGEYDLHADGGMIYNPLSREAARKGLLEKFQSLPRRSGQLDLGNATLRYQVPQAAEAYDVVPIEYVLEVKEPGQRPWAVEATAFEDPARGGGQALFDMSLPGDLSVKMEYVGCERADNAPSRPVLDPRNPDPKIEGFPSWKVDPLTRSGVIRKADNVWFTFKYTVTGNTILDPEGFNGVQSEVLLYKKSADGQYQFDGESINKWERNVVYQYPGESCQQTVLLSSRSGRGIPPGEYKVRFSLLQKAYTRWKLWENNWGGAPFAYMDVFLRVVDGPAEVTEPKVETTLPKSATSGNFPEFMHSFEEFMTGFEWFRQPQSRQSSVIYVQVAPWTQQINVKLLAGKPMELKVAAIPMTVSSANVQLKYNADNPFVVQRNGKETPVILAQLMPTMRHSHHFGPKTDLILQDLLKDAIACGANLYCSESGGWALADFFRTPKTHDAASEATRYFNHMLKSYDVPMIGHGVYPTEESFKFASKILNPPIKIPELNMGYGAAHLAYPEWSQTWAAIVLYHHKLWGDNWFKTRDGRTIIDIEDTTGWMREDLHTRYPVGAKHIELFQNWCRTKYGTIAKVNEAWSSAFKDFSEINPEANQSEVKPWGHKWEYFRKGNPVFYEWSAALNDFDNYLSEMRCIRYKEVLEIVRKTIPGAVISLRTEGGNFIIPDSSRLSDSPHESHVRNSARRNAEVGEVLSRYSDVIGFYSDYPTLPYTPDEWRKLTRLSVEKGIRPMPLPHLARSRDIAVQQKYGNDYTSHYNLKYPAKATMVFGLQALFPVMKAVYEEGGCCGVIWADYLCDAFVTETQKRELKLLRQAMDRMQTTP